jgi:hypothetical protein
VILVRHSRRRATCAAAPVAYSASFVVAIDAARFEIESLTPFKFRLAPIVMAVSPHILGRARRPGDPSA